jgi:hypothetical protein
MTSTLALKKSDYESEVGEYHGFGMTAEEWSARDLQIVQADVKAGLRKFYFCGHPWTFLNPLTTLTLESGAKTIPLPESFGGMDGGQRILVLGSSNQRVTVLPLSAPQKVEQMYQSSTQTGRPQMIAQRPIKNVPSGSTQRSELVVYPLADQAYTLKMHHFFTPDYLTDVNQPYAMGGPEHHQTILHCCLAQAELTRDNMLGVHNVAADRLLAQSMQIDRRKQPKKLGRDIDRSDELIGDDNFRGQTEATGMTYNGIFYS